VWAVRGREYYRCTTPPLIRPHPQVNRAGSGQNGSLPKVFSRVPRDEPSPCRARLPGDGASLSYESTFWGSRPQTPRGSGLSCARGRACARTAPLRCSRVCMGSSGSPPIRLGGVPLLPCHCYATQVGRQHPSLKLVGHPIVGACLWHEQPPGPERQEGTAWDP